MTDINQKIFKYLVYYPVVYLRRQNVPYYIKEFEKSQYYPKDKLAGNQLNKLKSLLEYAGKHVEFHKKAFSALSSRVISRLEDIEKFPFTTKSMLKENPDIFINKNYSANLTKKTTGGSTGEPVTILKTADAMARELAATWRGYQWAGIDIGDRQARLWGVPFSSSNQRKARLIDFVTNRRRCSAFSFNENDLDRYTDLLRKFDPVYFYGYVSMLVEYANYFESKKLKPPFNLKCVITTSEVLTEPQRRTLENTFNTRVFNEYGCGELGSVAHECENGAMHIMAENMIVEVVENGRICGAGEQGELVITELNNRAMPLIRYRTGDIASLSPKPCPCGRTLPIIENLYGRAYDMIRNANGRLFHGEFFMYIIEDAKRRNLGIGAFQIIQQEQELFRIRIKPEPGYCKETREFITCRIKEGFSANATVVFEEVAKIERAPSGKMRLIIGLHQAT